MMMLTRTQVAPGEDVKHTRIVIRREDIFALEETKPNLGTIVHHEKLGMFVVTEELDKIYDEIYEEL